ncbi:MAG: YbgC/FadM family acyl-CoA thioesterase [Candidatus Omnitrophica bacterium]|nr:YbgC/FadM family acyl-CoA thioesterase [Candidatus Omnitrophota bacterium]
MQDFYINKRIYYHDTDCGGVVYYANYLKHLEEARTEFCINRGIPLKELQERGIYFVVSRVEIDYKSPARYGDMVTISAKVEYIKRSSLSFYQEVKRGDTILIKAGTLWVCVDKSFKPRAVPDEIKDFFTK